MVDVYIISILKFIPKYLVPFCYKRNAGLKFLPHNFTFTDETINQGRPIACTRVAYTELPINTYWAIRIISTILSPLLLIVLIE